MNKELTYIDLFAGAGGLSEGFIRAGYKPVAHVEFDQAACFSLKTRLAYHYLKANNQIKIYTDYLKGKINREELYSQIPEEIISSVFNKTIGADNEFIFNEIEKLTKNKEVDLIIGGPPCQAYSLVGRARDENGMKNDKRNFLYFQYYNFLKKYNPKVFVFENVPGLLSARKGEYYKNMCNLFARAGYTTKHFKLEANHFGVLQNRKRILIIGYKKELNITLPDFENFRSNLTSEVNSIFSDLPKLQAGEGIDKYVEYSGKTNNWLENAHVRNGLDILTQHVARPHTIQDKEIYHIAVKKWNENHNRLDYNDLEDRLKTHKNRHSFFDRFKVVAADIPYSHTVVAHIAKDGHYYIHPDIEQNRSISVREAARLQSFPDDYYFEGVKEGANRTAAFKQIGNAVPPLMAYEIAQKIKELLCQIN
ncbi:MAG: DNA (cytosine-5-)-methyltransferase [Bacteroidales bacterium]|nr:DNA (cytosine-5-)-methyltransferase [Bacteroidales bacterium]